MLLRTKATRTIMLHLLLKNFCIFASFPSISPASRLPYHSNNNNNNNNKQQQILLKIEKKTNYITFPPANSLWTNRGGGSWRHITKQDLYISGPLFSRAAVPLCPTPQARFLFSFYRLFFLPTVSLLVECLSTSSCREEGLAQRTESRV